MWNLAASALYGWQPHEAAGRVMTDLFPPYPPEAMAALAAGGVWQGQVERQRFDGAALMVRIKCATSASLGMEEGGIVEVSSACNPRHPAEVRLAASEYRYRNLFGAVAAAFWELDFSGVGRILGGLTPGEKADLAGHLAAHPELVRAMMRATRVVDINQRSIELFGPGSKRELLAAPLDDYWPPDSHKDFAAAVVAAMSGQPHFICETRMRSLGGREFEALFTVSFLPATVGKGSLLIGFTDISERVRAARELALASHRERRFYEIPSIALSELDTSGLARLLGRLRAQGVEDLERYIDENPGFIDLALDAVTIIETNDAGARLCGAASRHDLVGQSLSHFFGPARDAFRRSIQATFRGEAVFQTELRMRRLDGTFADTLFCRVLSETHDTGRVLAAQLDITDQVRAREELEHLHRQLAHASRISLLGELSASIAHEISQPITAIANNAAAAERIAARPDMSPDQLITVSRRISRDAVRAGEIIARIRTMASNRQIQFVELDMAGVVADAHQLILRELRDHQVEVTFSFDAALPVVRGDRVQLQQVMVNLMMNAVQAMEAVPPARRGLRLAMRQAADMLEIEVSDTGPGFGDGGGEESLRSFHSTKPNGLGLGLSICRSILQGHGGQMSLRDALPRPGAVVTIMLPLAGGVDADHPSAG